MIDTIGLDADDTLWHNEVLYTQTKTAFASLFSNPSEPQLSQAVILKRLDDTEISNVSVYGYGIKSFLLSMLETALALSGDSLPHDKLGGVFQLGRAMLEKAVPLFPKAESTLKELSNRYPLLLITKGDTFEQTRKIQRTGLEGYFRAVEIVGDKTVDTYRGILRRHGIDPQAFIMVGNSQRSDILPVLELGGMAVYIPYESTWTHEHAEAPADGGGRYFELDSLGQLPELIQKIEHEG